MMFENMNVFDKDRIYGNVNVIYEIFLKLDLMVCYGLDLFNDLRVGKWVFSMQCFL